MLECRNGLQCQSRTESNQGEKRTFPSRRPRRPHLQIELGNASRKGVEFHLSEEHNVEHLTCRDGVVRVELQHCSRSTVRSAPRVGQEARACLRPCTTTARPARLAQAWNYLARTVQGTMFAIVARELGCEHHLLFAITNCQPSREVWLPVVALPPKKAHMHFIEHLVA
jgi:hypothetical protein